MNGAPRVGSIFCLSLLLPAQTPPAPASEPLRPFFSRSNIFRIDVPADWRQLAPAEVAPLRRAVEHLPADLGENEPNLFYGIGAVDRWLQGGFDGTYLYVVEQDNEWQSVDHLQQLLQEKWNRKGSVDGHGYLVSDVQNTEVGTDAFPAITCRRRITPPSGPAQLSLDVYVPTGGRQLTLCFTAFAADFDRELPRFRTMIDSIGLARRARGEADLEDRLWTPLIAGAVVGLLLAMLYRRNRRRPA